MKLTFISLCSAVMLFLSHVKVLAQPSCVGTQGSDVTYLDNGVIRLGIDLNRGGAITYLAKNGQPNMVNNYDNGRQIQLDNYQQPTGNDAYMFRPGGQSPAPSFSTLGHNAIHAGDTYGNKKRVDSYDSPGQYQLHTTVTPLYWPYQNQVANDIKFDTWYTVTGNRVHVKYRITNLRNDNINTSFIATGFAVYLNNDYHYYSTYNGNAPYTDINSAVTSGSLPFDNSPVAVQPGKHEGWFFLGKQDGNGLGFCSNVSSKSLFLQAQWPSASNTPGLSECDGATAFLEPQVSLSWHANTVIEFELDYILGTASDIRSFAFSKNCNTEPASIGSSIPRNSDGATVEKCAGQSVQLTAQNCDNGTVRWTDNQTSSGISVSSPKPYHLACTKNGCTSYTRGFVIVDKACNGSLVVSPSSVDNVSTGGIQQNIAVTSNGNWSVNTNGNSWITTNPGNGSGNGNFQLIVASNGGAARSGIVTVTDGSNSQTISVSQQGATTPPSTSSNCVTYSEECSGNVSEGSQKMLNVTTPGSYALTINYRSTEGDRNGLVKVGNTTQTILFPGNQTTLTTQPFNFTAGDNMVRLSTGPNGGYMCFSKICVGADGGTTTPPTGGTPTSGNPTNGSYEGYFDNLDCSLAHGWVWNSSYPNQPIVLEIVEGSTVLSTITASVNRPDLQDAGKGNGQHGFFWSVPASLKNGQPHTISIRAQGAGYVLNNSPRTISCPSGARLGSSNTESAGSLLVSPNPSNGRLRVQFGSQVGQTYEIRLVDLTGRQLQIWSVVATGLTMDENIVLPESVAGLVVLQVLRDGRLESKKVIVVR